MDDKNKLAFEERNKVADVEHLEKQPQSEKSKSGNLKKYLQKTSTKIVLGIIVSIIILVVGSVFVNNYYKVKFSSCLKHGDYAQAADLIGTKKADGEDPYIIRLSDFFEQVCTGYNEGSLSYDEAVEKIKKSEIVFEKLKKKYSSNDFQGNTPDAYIDIIQKLKDSKEHFAKGNEYLKKKDFFNAIIEFSQTSESDINYKDLKTIYEKHKKDFTSVIENVVKGSIDSGDLEQASRIAESAKEVLSKEELDKIKAQIQEKEKSIKEAQEIEKYKNLLAISYRVEQEYIFDKANIVVECKNLSADKTIKYVKIIFRAYNSVGDAVTKPGEATITGPIAPGAASGETWLTRYDYYNKGIVDVKASKIEIEYMDGTKETIPKKIIEHLSYV